MSNDKMAEDWQKFKKSRIARLEIILGDDWGTPIYKRIRDAWIQGYYAGQRSLETQEEDEET